MNEMANGFRQRPHATAVLLLLLLFVAACGKASMSGDEATQVALGAFRSAGLDPEVGEIVDDATVDRAIDGEFIQVHQVEMVIGEQSYLAGVNRKEGAVVRLIEPNDTALTEDEIATIAEYRDNPAEDSARRTRTVVWIVLILLGLAAATAFFRRERRKAEFATENAVDEISLD